MVEWVFLIIAAFVAGYFYGRQSRAASVHRITDFRQKRRIALRRASKQYLR